VKIYLTSIFEPFLIGTAWLSSVRVVECNIKLLNERNLYDKFYVDFLLKIQVRLIPHLLNETKYYLFKDKVSHYSIKLSAVGIKCLFTLEVTYTLRRL